MTLVLTEIACINCGKPVSWDKVGADWRLVERFRRTYRRHECLEPKNRPGAKSA